jgi:hypothetical protein
MSRDSFYNEYLLRFCCRLPVLKSVFSSPEIAIESTENGFFYPSVPTQQGKIVLALAYGIVSFAEGIQSGKKSI